MAKCLGCGKKADYAFADGDILCKKCVVVGADAKSSDYARVMIEISALRAENAAIRCLMDSYNVGGWTDTISVAVELNRLEAENAELRKDAERYRWLRDATGETPFRLAAYNSEISPDIRLKFDFPTLISYTCIGSQVTLDAAIDAEKEKQ